MRRSVVLLLVVAVALVVMVRLRGEGRGTGERAAREEEPPGSAPERAAAVEPVASGAARVRGVVRGPNGPVWRVRVVALDPRDGRELADAWTGPEGTYGMELGPGAFDLRAEPQDVTRLAPDERRGVRLAEGGTLTVDFEVVPGTVTRGSLRFPGETGRRLRVRAAPVAGGREQVVESRSSGRFEFVALEPGAYRLEVESLDWALEAPVGFRPGDEVHAALVPISRIDLEVEDLSTGAPVPRFEVRSESEVFEGRDGRLLVPRAEFHALSLEVVADDYFPDFVSTGRQRVRLRPLSEANLTILAEYDDGGPYEGRLLVKHREYAPVRRTGGGTWLAVIPPDTASVTVERFVIFETPQEVGVRLPAEVRLVFPRGGTILVRCRGSARPRNWVWMESAERGLDLELPGRETGFCDVPPGHYRFRSVPEEPVFAEIDVEAGSRHEIDYFPG